METARYILGVFILVVCPPALLGWFIIHGWTRRWRSWGPARTYLTVLPVLAALGVLLFRQRDKLLSVNLGTNWRLIVVALLLYCPITWLELRYWKHLSFRILVGIAELSPPGQSKLLTEGIYGVVRHPRYLSAGLGLIASALFVNYLGLYILLAAIALPGYGMLILEERELLDRFGDAYRHYQRDVPQLIPWIRKTVGST